MNKQSYLLYDDLSVIYVSKSFSKWSQNLHLNIWVSIPFFAKDYINDSNQDPDVNLYNNISSIKTS